VQVWVEFPSAYCSKVSGLCGAFTPELNFADTFTNAGGEITSVGSPQWGNFQSEFAQSYAALGASSLFSASECPQFGANYLLPKPIVSFAACPLFEAVAKAKCPQGPRYNDCVSDVGASCDLSWVTDAKIQPPGTLGARPTPPPTPVSANCEPGKFFRGGACEACAAGQFQSLPGQFGCNFCTPGKTASPDGTTSITCPAGYKCNGKTPAQPCTPGTYATPGATECSACNSDDMWSGAVAGACEECPAGSFTTGGDSTGQRRTACNECPAGSWCDGSSTVTPCEKGHYVTAGHSACWKCGADNMYSPNTGASACLSCANGSFTSGGDSETRNHCAPCTEGHKCDGTSTVTECTPGSFALGGSIDCWLCDKGTYQEHPRATKCNACVLEGDASAAGIGYADRKGQSQCMTPTTCTHSIASGSRWSEESPKGETYEVRKPSPSQDRICTDGHQLDYHAKNDPHWDVDGKTDTLTFITKPNLPACTSGADCAAGQWCNHKSRCAAWTTCHFEQDEVLRPTSSHDRVCRWRAGTGVPCAHGAVTCQRAYVDFGDADRHYLIKVHHQPRLGNPNHLFHHCNHRGEESATAARAWIENWRVAWKMRHYKGDTMESPNEELDKIPGECTCRCHVSSAAAEAAALAASSVKRDGGWSKYTQWSACSRSCSEWSEVGSRTRYRTCSNPFPAFGGKKCEGGYVEAEPCNTQRCPASIVLVGAHTVAISDEVPFDAVANHAKCSNSDVQDPKITTTVHVGGHCTGALAGTGTLAFFASPRSTSAQFSVKYSCANIDGVKSSVCRTVDFIA
jgi:hypothetical protein